LPSFSPLLYSFIPLLLHEAVGVPAAVAADVDKQKTRSDICASKW